MILIKVEGGEAQKIVEIETINCFTKRGGGNHHLGGASYAYVSLRKQKILLHNKTPFLFHIHH